MNILTEDDATIHDEVYATALIGDDEGMTILGLANRKERGPQGFLIATYPIRLADCQHWVQAE